MRSHTPVEFFEMGLGILAELGPPGLKLAELCRRLGVTTGAFYHHFDKWASYTDGLLDYWLEERTAKLLMLAEQHSDPRARLDFLVQVGLNLPHRSESAIRVWSGSNAKARSVQEAVDNARFTAMQRDITQIVGDEAEASKFAHWALYLLTGYEQVSLPENRPALEWSVRMLLDAVDAAASGVNEP